VTTTLLVDCHYMAWRAFYTTGKMSHEGQFTGVAFGILRDIAGLVQLHGATRAVLAFDSKVSRRKEIYSDYKIRRSKENQTEEQLRDREAFFQQIGRLKNDLLGRWGYRNILEIVGYEADDIIAAIAADLPTKDQAVIISADKDLLQCLRPNVVLYNPTQKKATTYESFRTKWKLHPMQWAEVKAIAGCGTDDVPGIPGVAEATAALWVRGLLKEKSKKRQDIENNLDMISRNRKLVDLPFPGLVLPPLQDDQITDATKADVEAELGIRAKRVSGSRKDDARKGFW